ncbi:MAG: gluconate 2-dehydrogenase subunit 3 family protein [Acidobacteriota bacterium]|nr:gluconate 2-dehydrogenase subunit 3 family protein [Acidobacteriota bacterium]
MGTAWVAANLPAILEAQKSAQSGGLTFFNPAQMKEVEAIVAQLIPADETPGAKEAHCHDFIDRALSGFAKANRSAYTKGLDDLQSRVQQMFPGSSLFSGLTSAQQIQVLTAIEKTPFFNLIRNHTVIGFFARPEHGGNYEKLGWKLIAYDDSMNFKPPFGYYDARALAAKKG